MSVYIITGEQGEGKGIMACQKMQEYILAGRRVVTNIDLRLEHLIPGGLKNKVERCSDFPLAEELWGLGKGCETYNEKQFGLIVLDEMGIYLNARDYKAEGRNEFIKWLRHVRKMHWDLMLLVQSADSLDKQIRGGLAHYQVKCRAGDKMTVPMLSPICKFLFGKAIHLPKFHAGIVFRGFGAGQVKIDTWFTRGVEFYKAYDTGQIYTGENVGVSEMLCPYKYEYMRRPTGWREDLRAIAAHHREKRPWLGQWLPKWLFGPSQRLCRYIDFMLSQTEGLPSKPVFRHPSYNDWLSAQISAQEAQACGVCLDLSKDTSEPLQQAA